VSAVLGALEDAGIPATHDPGAFYPQPVAVLVAMPSLLNRGLANATFSIQILVVSGDPLNSLLAVDRLVALADDVAIALGIAEWRPSQWSGNVQAEPLPAIELAALVTITHTQTRGGSDE
jgi:hypothetical protein